MMTPSLSCGQGLHAPWPRAVAPQTMPSPRLRQSCGHRPPEGQHWPHRSRAGSRLAITSCGQPRRYRRTRVTGRLSAAPCLRPAGRPRRRSSGPRRRDQSWKDPNALVRQSTRIPRESRRRVRCGAASDQPARTGRCAIRRAIPRVFRGHCEQGSPGRRDRSCSCWPHPGHRHQS